MPTERARLSPLLTLTISLSVLPTTALARIDPSLVIEPRSNDAATLGDPLYNWDYLPAQIGGIVGAYAVSLVLVAIVLLALSKKRRDHLAAGLHELDFAEGPARKEFASPDLLPPTATKPGFAQAQQNLPSLVCDTNLTNLASPKSFKSFNYPSPVSSIGAPGISPFVDQNIVAADKIMAQSQLEEMYKHVLEQEAAKKQGVEYQPPSLPGATYHMRESSSVSSLKSPAHTLTKAKKERSKPAGLNLVYGDEEKAQSRTSSLLSVLRSPRKKSSMRAMSISSPIMTPQSATFPRHESQEMSAIPPRQYAPPPPPPIPTDHVHFGAVPITPVAVSPESTQSIDGRIGAQLPSLSQTHTRTTSQAPSEAEAEAEAEPESASSEHSQARLVGLPSTPKPGARFPTLPASPKPGQTFRRSNPPSAVRTGGALPFRAYEPALNTPSVVSHTTKQTVFERRGPLSPGGGMTPFTATAVPYSPYQPFTPCVPMTPSLVTKEDRKRMRRLVPKTPTLAMVKSEDDIW